MDRHDLDLQELAEQLWRRERPVCQTALVFELILQHEDEWDNIENLCPDPSGWSEMECRDWLMDNVSHSFEHGGESVETLRSMVQDQEVAADILEWWLISDWFADLLRSQGECILANDYGTWWGRQCSGQSTALDSCIQRAAIAATC